MPPLREGAVMKKGFVMLLLAAFAAAASGYVVDPTQNQFCFEERSEIHLKSVDAWVSVSPGRTAVSSGSSATFTAIVRKPFTTVGDWGLSTSADIRAAVWQGVSSTNYVHSYESSYAAASTVYLYPLLRYFRYSLVFSENGGSAVSPQYGICYTNSVTLPTPTRTGYTF